MKAMNFSLVLAIFVILCTKLCHSWNLSNIFDNKNYTIVNVSVYFVRAFLCISTSDESLPTLVEATWPENLLPIKAKVFPDILNHAKQKSECNNIIAATATDIDTVNGHMWIIDNGSRYCKPKLITFSLVKRYDEVHRYIFKRFQSNSFTSINVAQSPNDISNNQTQVYLTVKEQHYIIAYSIAERKWCKLKMLTNNNMIVVPSEITFNDNGNMFIADESNNLWQTQIDKLKVKNLRKSSYLQLHVKHVNKLLGTAKCLITDALNVLYYYLPKDGVVVRWNSTKPLTAENHDILYFSPVPIVQIVFGAQGSVWIIEEVANADDDHCRRILTHFLSHSQLAPYY